MNRFLQIFLVVALFTLLPAAALAGTISMNSFIESKEVDGRMGLEVAVRNDGDESARSVQVHVELAGDELTGPKWETMAPKEKMSHVFFFEKMPEKPGTWPVLVTIDFADLNMYPFTALNVAALQVGHGTGKAQIFAKASPITFSKSDTLEVSIKNQDGRPKSLKARVLAPREINVSPVTFDLDLAPNAVVDRDVEVSNFSALPGAGYPIFVVFEYDQGGTHYSYSLNAFIKIAQGGLSKTVIILIIAFGSAIVVAAVIFSIVLSVRKT